MNERGVRRVLGVVLVFAAMNFLSCMHERKLVSITIHPSGFTFPTPNSKAEGVFTALGSYIHPPRHSGYHGQSDVEDGRSATASDSRRRCVPAAG